MMRPPGLSTQIALALGLVLAVGVGLGHVWTQAGREWAAHLDRANRAGVALYASLAQPGLPAPQGLVLTRLAPGAAPPFAAIPQPLRETRLTLLDRPAGTADRDDRSGPGTGASGAAGGGSGGGGGGGGPSGGGTPGPVAGGARLALVIVSPDMTYPAAGLDSRAASPAERLGDLTRAMARQCSDAVLFAQRDIGAWVRVDGLPVWSCAARPADRRLPATLLGTLILAMVLGWLVSQRAAVDRLVTAMTDRFGGRAQGRIPLEGPAEVQALARAANALTAREAARLESRAAILAGISHDLGAPMTRLRLRAALIPDPDLRARIGRDIDQMGDMIDAVLTHTREEMATEAPRMVSVLSLVQSVADDFADLGAPVRLLEVEGLAPEPAPSLFAGAAPRSGPPRSNQRRAARARGAALAGDRRLLALCRPNALRRAVTNLVDNALKYGRRAEIEILADADTLTIVVRDAGGGGLRAGDLDALIAPFSRGSNAAQMRGSGMGLAIVDAIARQHGGHLDFADAGGGIAARLTIRRG